MGCTDDPTIDLERFLRVAGLSDFELVDSPPTMNHAAGRDDFVRRGSQIFRYRVGPSNRFVASRVEATYFPDGTNVQRQDGSSEHLNVGWVVRYVAEIDLSLASERRISGLAEAITGDMAKYNGSGLIFEMKLLDDERLMVTATTPITRHCVSDEAAYSIGDIACTIARRAHDGRYRVLEGQDEFRPIRNVSGF